MWYRDQLVDKKFSRISDIHADGNASFIKTNVQNIKIYLQIINKKFIVMWSTSVTPLSFAKILREISKICILCFRSKLLFEK